MLPSHLLELLVLLVDSCAHVRRSLFPVLDSSHQKLIGVFHFADPSWDEVSTAHPIDEAVNVLLKVTCRILLFNTDQKEKRHAIRSILDKGLSRTTDPTF